MCVIVEPRRKQTFGLLLFFIIIIITILRKKCRLEFETIRFERKATHYYYSLLLLLLILYKSIIDIEERMKNGVEFFAA